MELNLTKTIQSKFADSTLSAIGGQLGLDPRTATAGTAALIPVILAAMSKADYTRAAVDQLMKIARSGNHDGTLIDQFPSLLSSGRADVIPSQGNLILQKLLGDDAEFIIAAVGTQLSFKPSVVRSLWAMTTPLVVDAIGHEMETQGWTFREFRSRLASQKSELAEMMPPDVAVSLGLLTAQLSTHTADRTAKSSRIDLSYIIAFIVSAFVVFAIVQAYFKSPPPEKPGVNEPLVNEREETSATVDAQRPAEITDAPPIEP